MKRLMLLITCACAIRLAPSAHAAIPNFKHTGPTYKFSLTENKENRGSDVCEHLLAVFNDQFAHLWAAPLRTSMTDDPVYSADSKYAFPRLAGTEYSEDPVYQWRFFSQPAPPEFSAIHWEEGTAFSGGCPAGSTCSGEQPFQVLIAHFDFDNDGTMDTVIKQGYFPGYPGSPWSVETLIVWRGQDISLEGVANLWNLEHPQDNSRTPIISLGMYVRPFIYAKQTYMLRYAQDQDDPVDPDAQHGPRPKSWQPHQEDMLVQQYSFMGQKDVIGRPQWTVQTVCDFEMKQLNDKQ